MPWLWVRECARVVKPGGYLILITPVSWPYHPAPVDCWRIYPEAMTTLLREARCEVLVSLFASEEAVLHGIANPVPGLGLDFHLLPRHEEVPPDHTARLRQSVKRHLASRGFPFSAPTTQSGSVGRNTFERSNRRTLDQRLQP